MFSVLRASRLKVAIASALLARSRPFQRGRLSLEAGKLVLRPALIRLQIPSAVFAVVFELLELQIFAGKFSRLLPVSSYEGGRGNGAVALSVSPPPQGRVRAGPGQPRRRRRHRPEPPRQDALCRPRRGSRPAATSNTRRNAAQALEAQQKLLSERSRIKQAERKDTSPSPNRRPR